MTNRKDNKGRVLYKGEFQQADGRYRYSYTDALKKRHCVYATSLLELRELEKKIQMNISEGICENRTTLNKSFAIYIQLKSNIKETTKKHYEHIWELYVKNKFIGDMRISEIKNVHVKMLYKNMVDNGYSKSTISLVHELLTEIFEEAIDNDVIRKNPCKHALREIKDDRKEKIPLTKEQCLALVEFGEKSKRYKYLTCYIQIALGTCMRVSEICGLTWDDIDLKNRVISVNHQVLYKNVDGHMKYIYSSLKTEACERDIYITKDVYKALIQLKKLNLSMGKQSTFEVNGCTNFILYNENNEPCNASSMDRQLVKMVRDYNKSNPNNKIHHITTHTLRHTGCTLYAQSGMELKALQYLMGHKDANMTLNVYNHGSYDRTTEEIKRIENIRKTS